jgi:acetyl esterase/lipase
MVTTKDPEDPHRSLPVEAGTRRIHHRHSAQSVAVSLASRLIVKNAVRAWAMQPNLHWPLEYVDSMAGLLPRFRSSAKIEPIRLEHCTAEWVRARGASSARAILYLHGGAFLTCGLNTHRSLVCRLSKAADAGVLTVGYRKLPSHQIADAIADGISGLRWLQQRGYDDQRIVVAGDSAGGYLAFMTTLAAIRTHLAKPAGIATVSPYLCWRPP